MPVFVAALLTGLLQIAASVAGRVLIAAGVGIVTFSGMSVLLQNLTDQIFTALGAAGPLVQLAGTLRLGASVNVILSAYTIRMTLDGLSAGGSISRWVTK